MAKQQRSHYEQLINSLDQFIRKYYLNQAIRGALYWVAAAGLLFLAYSVLEHQFYFGRGVRKFLFFSFIIGNLAGLVYWIGLPLMKYMRLGKRISHEQAAGIIGAHFNDVSDKLLNILQLRKQAEKAPSPELALASIEQKTQSIRLIPFKSAIDLTQNRRYLRYALPPMLILLALLVAAPSVIKDSTSRIIKNNRDFERDAPFHFLIPDADDLSVVQYEDFILQVEVDGAALPDEVFIDVEEYQYRMKKKSPTSFTYRFKNVHQETDFRLFSGPVASRNYTLEVLKKPNLLSFDVRLDYPSYISRQDETLSNIGDLVVPAGTAITWSLNTLNTDKVRFRFGSGESVDVEQRGTDLFSMQESALEDGRYTVFLANEQIGQDDSIAYTINVIPDLYPKINVEQIRDSIDEKLVYFVGSTGDDYGITNLTFNYRIVNDRQEESPLQTFPLSVKHPTQFQYDYTFDLNELTLKPGDELTYYFEVFDNDAINGRKSTKTTIMQFSKPSIDEYEQIEEENSKDIKETLEKALKESQKLREEMRKMREKLLQEKDLEWQNKKELENLMQRQQNLQNDLQNAQDLFQENQQNQEEFKDVSEEQQRKQEKLNEFFDELMNEEMQEMMEQLSEQMEELEKKDALEMLENFELSEEELQKELDRLMELFKQMELEQKIQEQVQKLEELADKEEELSEKTKDAEFEDEITEESETEDTQEENESEQGETEQEETEQSGNQEGEKSQEQEEQGDQEGKEQSNDGEQSLKEQLQQEQKEIQEEFEEIREDMEDIQKKNQELEKPKNLDDSDEQMDRIEQDMQNSQQQMQQNQGKKASQSQKSAAQRMRDMAQQMSSQMMQGQMQQMQADLSTLRQLLENLITLSFEQEDIIDDLNGTNATTPRYVGLVQDQFKIQDDFKVVEDTLQALSKRVMQIESFITEKVTEVKSNLQHSLTELEERKKATAADYQQRTMTNLNDLALMLSEVMNQMQQQMSMMMPGNQMCNNPGASQGQTGQGRVPLDKITEGQQQLNEDMKKMAEEMRKGRQEGEKGSAEQFARMAARQSALRKALRDMQQEKQQRGEGDQSLENTINQMDETETELVNKRLTNEMLKRQAEILTRLLEAERAERQREMDNKRKAETAQQVKRKLPPSIEEYIKQREAEVESFQTVSPNLRPYYKFLVEEYYDALKKQ